MMSEDNMEQWDFFWDVFFLRRNDFFGLRMEEKREKSGAEAEFPPEEPSLPLMGVVTSFKNFIIPMSFALQRKSFKLFQLFFRFSGCHKF